MSNIWDIDNRNVFMSSWTGRLALYTAIVAASGFMFTESVPSLEGVTSYLDNFAKEMTTDVIIRNPYHWAAVSAGFAGLYMFCEWNRKRFGNAHFEDYK